MTIFNINLIANRRRQKQRSLMLMRASFYSLIGLGALTVVVYLTMWVAVEQTHSQIRAIQAELSAPELADKVAHIKLLEKETAELTPRLQLLEKVHSSEAEWIRILYDISACIPQDVWLEQMNTRRSETEQTISLKGRALHQAEVGAFMLALNQPAWNTTTALIYSQAASNTGLGSQYFEFEITVPLKTVIGSNLK